MRENNRRDISSVDLSRRNEELENYFANTIIPQLFVDSDLILRKFTPPAMRNFSLSDKDIGRHIQDVKDNIRYPTIIENIREVIATQQILEKEVQTTDGEWFQMNILPYVIRKENRTNGVIITFVNITRRIANLKELEKLNVERETLSYTLTHDIRQPLTTITLLTKQLQEAFNEGDAVLFSRWIDSMRKAFNTMNSLVNDFITGSKKSELTQVAERVNIENIYQDVLLTLKDDIAEKEVSVTTEFNTSEITFSRINLRSIVFNLLYNAIKFRRPEVSLQITISTKKLKNYVMLSVEDNGRGIAPEHLQTVFYKEARLNKDIEGTGMGLYLIKQMVTNRGGKIQVESTLGKGTVFRVYFKSGYKGELEKGL